MLRQLKLFMGPLFQQWEEQGIAFKASNEADPVQVVIAHIMWADNIWLFVSYPDQARYMLASVTSVLVGCMGLQWKGKSLEALCG